MTTMLNTRSLALIPRLAAGWPSAATPSYPVFPATRFFATGWWPVAPRDQSW